MNVAVQLQIMLIGMSQLITLFLQFLHNHNLEENLIILENIGDYLEIQDQAQHMQGWIYLLKKGLLYMHVLTELFITGVGMEVMETQLQLK